jgi:hypothetical protein
MLQTGISPMTTECRNFTLLTKPVQRQAFWRAVMNQLPVGLAWTVGREGARSRGWKWTRVGDNERGGRQITVWGGHGRRGDSVT